MTAESQPRVLIYGMQSSGASLLALLAAQASETLAVIDLWNPEVAPEISHAGPIVLKATTGPVSLTAHIARFRPTALVLMLRHPFDQISVLGNESFRDYALPIEAKLRTFDRVFAHADDFDAVVSYEQLIAGPSSVAAALRNTGLPLPADAHLFPRSVQEVVAYAREHSSWCEKHWRTRWGTGRLDPTNLATLRVPPVRQTSEAMSLAREHCPALLMHYT